MLQLRNVALRRGTRLLFDSASLQIHPGQKVGVAGANGTGKSSLFALLRGELHADSGDVEVPADWQIASVAQELANSEQSAVEFAIDGDTELRELQHSLGKLEVEDGDGVADCEDLCPDTWSGPEPGVMRDMSNVLDWCIN